MSAELFEDEMRILLSRSFDKFPVAADLPRLIKNISVSVHGQFTTVSLFANLRAILLFSMNIIFAK